MVLIISMRKSVDYLRLSWSIGLSIVRILAASGTVEAHHNSITV